MLTCFNIENVLNGLTLFLSDVFKTNYKTKTIVLDSETAKVINEQIGRPNKNFAIELVKSNDNIVLFEIEIEGRGTILLDLF